MTPVNMTPVQQHSESDLEQQTARTSTATAASQTRRIALAALALGVVACCGVAFLLTAPNGAATNTFASAGPKALQALQQKDEEEKEIEEIEKLEKDPKEIKKIAHEIFEQADKDEDGELKMKEIVAASKDFHEFGEKYGLRKPTEEEQKEFIDMIPLDKKEFDKILDKVIVEEEEGEEEEELEKDPKEIKKIGHEIFDEADKDEDGELSMKELEGAGKDFAEFGEKYGLREPTKAEIKEFMKKIPLDKKEFDEILDKVIGEEAKELDPDEEEEEEEEEEKEKE